MEKLKQKSKNNLESLAVKSTKWIGSTSSILIHTAIFIISFALYFFGIDMDKILLVVTTIVSLEAIYLAIFIQMSVNRNANQLLEVAEDIDEIQEDVEGIEKDIDEIQEDVEGIEKDVDEIQEDIEEDTEEEQEEDKMLENIENTLGKLIEEIIELKKQHRIIIEDKKKK